MARKGNITLERMANLVSCKNKEVLSVDDYLERLAESSSTVYAEVLRDCLNEGMSEDEAQAKAEDAEQKEIDHYAKQYRAALEYACEKMLEEHGLLMQELKTKPGVFKLRPVTTWKAAAARLAETINGVGMFHFGSVQEFADSVPDTMRGTVLQHLHWMCYRPEVYGSTSYASLVHSYLR